MALSVLVNRSDIRSDNLEGLIGIITIDLMIGIKGLLGGSHFAWFWGLL